MIKQMATDSVAKAKPYNYDAQGGFDMKKYLMAALMAVLAAALFANAGNAATSKVQDTCPAPFGSNFTCTFQPATVTTTSHTHIVVHSKVTKDVKTYDKLTGHVAIIAVKPRGATSLTGCIDPVTAGLIAANGDFQNSGSNTGFWWTHWKAGWTICGAHKVNIGGFMYWEGRKGNCWNLILIPIGQAPPHVTVIVDEFKTVTVFYSMYDKVVKQTSNTSFSCANFPGSSLTIINGKGMCFIAVQIPVTPTPSPTCPSGTTGTPPNCVIVVVNCPSGTTKDSAGNCVAIGVNCPTGTVKDSNGTCVVQTNTAALNCQQTAQSLGPNTTWSFNNNTLTCQIIQINGTCSNITVIIGGGSPVVHQEGNCNTAPPPAPPTPPSSISNLTLVQEVYVNEVRPNICVNTNVTGASGTVVFTAQHGFFGGSPVPVGHGVTTSGVCATYTAPSDPMTDSITVTLYVDGQNPVSVSGSITVLPLPPRPLSDNLSSNELNSTL